MDGHHRKPTQEKLVVCAHTMIGGCKWRAPRAFHKTAVALLRPPGNVPREWRRDAIWSPLVTVGARICA